MVTTALGKLLWNRFSNVSTEFLNSPEGREKVLQATKLLLERAGDKEAKRFESLCLVNSLLPPTFDDCQTMQANGRNGDVGKKTDANATYGKLTGHAHVEDYTRAVKADAAQSESVKSVAESQETLSEEAVAFLSPVSKMPVQKLSVQEMSKETENTAETDLSDVSEARPQRRSATYGKGQRSIMFTNGKGAWRFRRNDWKRWLVAMSQQKKGTWIDPSGFGAVHLGPLVCDVSSWSREDYLKALGG